MQIITKSGADRILTMDLHAGQIQGFFDIPVDDLTSRLVFARDIKRQINVDEEPVNVLTNYLLNAGGTVRARKSADMYYEDYAIVDKRNKDLRQKL